MSECDPESVQRDSAAGPPREKRYQSGRWGGRRSGWLARLKKTSNVTRNAHGVRMPVLKPKCDNELAKRQHEASEKRKLRRAKRPNTDAAKLQRPASERAKDASPSPTASENHVAIPVSAERFACHIVRLANCVSAVFESQAELARLHRSHFFRNGLPMLYMIGQFRS